MVAVNGVFKSLKNNRGRPLYWIFKTTLSVACTRLIGAAEEQSGNAQAALPTQNSRLHIP